MSGKLSTLIEGQAIPKIPSNLEARKEIPSRVVTCPNKAFSALRPATSTLSWPTNPTTAPEPYLMLNLVPLVA